MIDQFLKEEVLLQVNNELKHQVNFINNMEKINSKLESEGSTPLYSIQELIKSGESYIHSIKRAVANLPLEEEIE